MNSLESSYMERINTPRLLRILEGINLSKFPLSREENKLQVLSLSWLVRWIIFA